MRALIVSGVRVGSFWNMSAAAPATIGVAMLVPLSRVYFPLTPVVQIFPNKLETQLVIGEMLRLVNDVTSVLPGEARETIRLPGATRSGFTTWSSSVGPFEL